MFVRDTNTVKLTEDVKLLNSNYLARSDGGPRPVEILIVEDNVADAILAKAALHDAGLVHRTTVVRDGENALALLRRHGKYADAVRPDVVLLDLNLPKVSGYQILDEIRAVKPLHGIPVIVLSGIAVPKNMRRENEQNITVYLVKPLQLKEYLNIALAIRKICNLVEQPIDR